MMVIKLGDCKGCALATSFPGEQPVVNSPYKW